jgi:succinate dehydrogenase / fumarate reductase iron-sulfur subunit
MVQLTLPKNSQVKKGKTWPKPDGATRKTCAPSRSIATIPRPVKIRLGHVLRRHLQVRTDDPGRLFFIKNEIDTTLAFRRSCREGICGSCAMNIGGRNTIACTNGIDEIKGAITIAPLPHQPVVRDLIPDLTQFLRPARHVSPTSRPIRRSLRRNGNRARKTAKS